MTDTITLPRATVQQALEALERADKDDFWREQRDAITALRTALEPPQQQAEPVAAPYNLDSTKAAVVAQDFYWLPIDGNTPRGVKVLLLGLGGVASLGHYHHKPGDTEFWTHWAPLPKKSDGTIRPAGQFHGIKEAS